MNNKIDTTGIAEYLDHILTHGRNETFAELEAKFGISPYPSKAGHRALGLWQSFYKKWTDEGMTPAEYVESISGKRKTVDVIKDENAQHEWEYTPDTAYFNGSTERPITTLEDALIFANVDTNVWEVDKWKLKSWDVSAKSKDGDGLIKRTNYGIQVWLTRKAISDADRDQVFNMVRDSFDKIKVKKAVGNFGIGVVNVADFHLGADVSNLIKAQDFNVDILVKHLNTIVETINAHGFSEVHVNMVGDYFESISGLNHLDSFKSIGPKMYGAPVIKLASEVISKFLSGINNLKCVNLISGNHDRITANYKLDREGSGAEILAMLLDHILSGVEIDYHPYLISKDIDGIRYLLTHGHFGIDKKDSAKIVKLYGSGDLYTLWLSGHLHTRQSERVLIKKSIKTETYYAVSMDEADYRKLILPSLFTGNFFSETLGYSTCGGFVITENNGNGKPNVYDIAL